ncbi:MAG: hypothetical protein SH847_23315 [Roseiflexaceae bacterium]|nr:hypothetical protein [Roseiflexaceae bacterium]
MTKSSPKRSATSVPGIKYLITTASLAATIAGWSALTYQAPKAADAAILPTAAIVEQVLPQPPLIATLVPLTTLAARELPALVPVAQAPNQTGSSRTVSVVASAPITAAPAAVAPEPVVVAPVAPVLRQVSAPVRQPVTTTRSSP